MKPALRKFVLAIHLSVAVGWIGAAVAYLAVGVSAEVTSRPETVRNAWMTMELIGWYVVVPFAVAALVTGVLMALGTPWGLFRHYWVIFSLALTGFAAAVVLLHMPGVSSTANRLQQADDRAVQAVGGDLAHPAIGLVVLLAVLVLNVYKPRGLTRYGQRERGRWAYATTAPGL